MLVTYQTAPDGVLWVMRAVLVVGGLTMLVVSILGMFGAFDRGPRGRAFKRTLRSWGLLGGD